MSNKNFKIDGSLTTTGDINIQGTLNINGKTTTLDQETLTIKDNLIAVNGDGISLETVGKTGIVAITGKTNKVIKTGYYKFNVQGYAECINTSIATDLYFGNHLSWYDEDAEYSHPEVRLYPTGIRYKGNVIDNITNVDIYCGLYSPDGPPMGIEIYAYCQKNNMQYESYDIGKIYIDNSTSNTIKYQSNNDVELYFDNYILEESKEEYITKLLTGLQFVKKGQAYASPIYDVNEDSLKIGLGSYEKDENGDILSFTFGSGQSQSIATRPKNIKHNSVVKWNDNKHVLEETQIQTTNTSVKINSLLKADSFNVKDNFVVLNSDGSTLDASQQAGVITLTGKENQILTTGDYYIDCDALAKYLEIETAYDSEMGEYGIVFNQDSVDTFNSLHIRPNIVTQGDDTHNTLITSLNLWTSGGMIPYSMELTYDYLLDENDASSVAMSGFCSISYNSQDYTYNVSVNDHKLYLVNYIVSEENKDLLCKILKKYGTDEYISYSDITVSGQAYASPVYDSLTDTLKIGVGNYTKDIDGNVVNFQFDSNQGKIIATQDQIDGKVSRITGNTGYMYLYAQNSSGTDTKKIVSTTNSVIKNGNIPQYFDKTATSAGANEPSGKGVLVTSIPTQDYHCAPKKYVDDAIANVVITGGGGSVVTVGGNPVATFDADTKLDATTVATTSGLGLIKGGSSVNNAAYINTNTGYGDASLYTIFINSANETNIRNRKGAKYGNGVGVIAPDNMDLALKISLTTNTQVLTTEEQQKAQQWLGITSGDGKLYKRKILMLFDGAERYVWFTTYSKTNTTMDFANATIEDLTNHLTRYYSDSVGGTCDLQGQNMNLIHTYGGFQNTLNTIYYHDSPAGGAIELGTPDEITFQGTSETIEEVQ